MSGQATGWVLRHGPKDRAQRAVLLTIADAANRDGEHAHPGIPAMVEGSLYSRSTVLAKVRELVEGGWISIEEEGRGRGHATVYRVLMERSEDRTLSDDKRSDLATEKVRSSDPAPLTPTVNNGTTSEETPSPSEPEASGAKKSRARDLVWDAVVQALGWDPKTKQESTRVGRAVREIRAAVPDDAEDEVIAQAVHGRARRYRAEWPNAEFTPEALVKHWSRFGPKRHDPDGRTTQTRAERNADPAMTTEAWAEQAITAEEQAAARRRIAWHAFTRRAAEERGSPWEATDPPEGWMPSDAPESTVSRPESSEQDEDGGTAAEGAA